MSTPDIDKSFLTFAKSLEALLDFNDEARSSDKDFTAIQKKDVESLIASEQEFRRILQADSRGELIYKAFVKYIRHERKNILGARPYFRERQEKFSEKISPALRNENHKALYKFNINFPFIQFVLKSWDWGKNSKIRKAAKAVDKIRSKLIVQNMPLAVSRAKIFKRSTPEGHLSYMDLVQIALEGLCNAVDKYVLPYSPVFRSVCIGRATGDLIENFSETMLHFYPGDKRKIYRARKARSHRNKVENHDDFTHLAKEVNSGVPLESPTTANEIYLLTEASEHVSVDSHVPVPDADPDEATTVLSTYVAPDDNQPDIKAENIELNEQLFRAIITLDLVERKLLAMMGISYA